MCSAKLQISSLFPGSCPLNWLQGNARIRSPVKYEKIYMSDSPLKMKSHIAKITFAFGILVVKFVQFLVIRWRKTAFRSNVHDQAHVVFVSESETKVRFPSSLPFVTRVFATYSLGQRNLLSSDGIGRKIVNRCRRFVILISAHRCRNCNCNHLRFPSDKYVMRAARCASRWKVISLCRFRSY